MERNNGEILPLLRFRTDYKIRCVEDREFSSIFEEEKGEGIEYNLYTDGSAYPGYKRGGWAFHLSIGTFAITESGLGQSNDANNMELLAVVNGLEAIPGKGAKITIHTDSLFVIYSHKRTTSKYKWMTPLLLTFRQLCIEHQISFIQILRGQRPPEHLLVHHLAREAANTGVDKCKSAANTPQN